MTAVLAGLMLVGGCASEVRRSDLPISDDFSGDKTAFEVTARPQTTAWT